MLAHWRKLRTRLAREQTVLLTLVAAYVVTGKLGLLAAYVHPAVSLLWAPSGIALAAFLVQGYRVWPAVLVSAVLLYSSTIGPTPVVLAIGVASTVEGLLAAYLINRFAGGRHALQNPQNSFRFAGLTALTSMT